MKQMITTLFMTILVVMGAFAQGNITGTLYDNDTNEPLIGASVMIVGQGIGTISDFDGSFTIVNVPEGTHDLTVSYIGYETTTQSISVGNEPLNLGKMKIGAGAVGLSEVTVIASVAVDRKTPVAVTTIKGDQISALVGNQEYPEILRNTPSVYVTKSGGGFGDARMNVRGFDQRNVAVMINGVPVNDMENGWVYWSNWAGLSDVTSNLQIQRGLGASKLAVPSVGGSVNIITNAAELDKGAKLSLSAGNDGFQKYGVMLSSGLSESGFAASAQFTHTRGNGYIDGTKFQAYSYFLSLSQRLSDSQTLAFSVVGAPQWHHQRTTGRFDNINLQTFQDKGLKYNPVWGELDGEEFTWRKNFYHKPKAFLNHYWTISDKTSLKTSAYVSTGRGGGTGPRGRITNGPGGGTIFDSYSGDGVGIHDANGQVRFDDIAAYNSGTQVADFGDANTESGTTTSSGDGFIRRASMNSHNWYGVLSTLSTEITDGLTLTGGVDYRYYKGIHYRRLENLLGNNNYVSRANDNNELNTITEASAADFFNFADNSYEDGTNVLNYHNDGLVNWLGLFGQAEYSLDKLTAFLSLSGSNQGFKRVDYFNYYDEDTRQAISDTISTMSKAEWLEDNPSQESGWENFLGGTVKLGANYNINDQHNVFVNTGFFSRQPIFDNVFINFVNNVNPDAKNQRVTAFELGYGFRSSKFRANVNLYNTAWGNRQFDYGVDLLQPDSTINNGLAIFDDVSQTHRGIEFEATYSPVRNLSVKGMLSVGDWKFTKDFTGNITDTDTGQPAGTQTLYAQDLKIGDAAQTTASIGIDFEAIEGLRLNADVYYAGNLYPQFDIANDAYLTDGNELYKLPAYTLVNGGVSYGFDVNGIGMTARINVNNVLDTEYVAETTTNIQDDESTQEDEFLQNRGWYGFGRTWNASLKFNF